MVPARDNSPGYGCLHDNAVPYKVHSYVLVYIRLPLTCQLTNDVHVPQVVDNGGQCSIRCNITTGKYTDTTMELRYVRSITAVIISWPAASPLLDMSPLIHFGYFRNFVDCVLLYNRTIRNDKLLSSVDIKITQVWNRWNKKPTFIRLDTFFFQ